MFTGIISGLGRIVDVQALGADPSHGRRLTIEAPAGYLDDVQLGDSIALNGACMTVTRFDPAARRFSIDISAESLDKLESFRCGAQPHPAQAWGWCLDARIAIACLPVRVSKGNCHPCAGFPVASPASPSFALQLHRG